MSLNLSQWLLISSSLDFKKPTVRAVATEVVVGLLFFTPIVLRELLSVDGHLVMNAIVLTHFALAGYFGWVYDQNTAGAYIIGVGLGFGIPFIVGATVLVTSALLVAA
jgi:hypothetical protein